MNDLPRTFAAILESRGLTVADLAVSTGLSVNSIEHEIREKTFSARRIRKIENALGQPLWTPLERFREINRASELLGTDAILTGFQELRRRAIAMKIPNARRLTSKDELICAVLVRFPAQANSSVAIVGFPVRLRNIRECAALSQPEFARAVGLSTSYVNLLESGSRNSPTIETVDRICTFFGVTRDWLLDGGQPQFLTATEAAADTRDDEMRAERFSPDERWELKNLQVNAQIRVRLAQLRYSTPELWREYREQIIAIIDAHALGVAKLTFRQ